MVFNIEVMVSYNNGFMQWLSSDKHNCTNTYRYMFIYIYIIKQKTKQ